MAILIPLAVAVFSLFIYWKHERRLKKQQEEINEYNLKEYKKEKELDKMAKIEATVHDGPNGMKKVRIQNSGRAMARNVKIKIPEDLRKHVHENPFPLDIKPQLSNDISLFIWKGIPNQVILEFEWEDEYRKDNEDSQLIQL